jgi:hypothetical protein
MSTLSESVTRAGDPPTEPMTACQRHYLESLCREAREPMPSALTRDEADVLIDRLQRATGRGLGG